jgi:hypothetical protein
MISMASFSTSGAITTLLLAMASPKLKTKLFNVDIIALSIFFLSKLCETSLNSRFYMGRHVPVSGHLDCCRMCSPFFSFDYN